MKDTSRMSSTSSHERDQVRLFIFWQAAPDGHSTLTICYSIVCLLDKQDGSLDRDVNPMPYGLITVLASAGALETAYLTVVRGQLLPLRLHVIFDIVHSFDVAGSSVSNHVFLVAVEAVECPGIMSNLGQL